MSGFNIKITVGSLLLILLAIFQLDETAATSGFDIRITAGATLETSSVSVSGKIEHVITDTERYTFSLSDYELKKIVEKTFGKMPNDAYLHSPTPWGDLYKRYGWQQTQTTITCTSAEIVSFEAKPTIVTEVMLKNPSNITGQFHADVTQEVTQSTSTSWQTSNQFTASQMFKYEIGFLGTGGGGETSMSYTHSWGQGGSETKQVTLGSTFGVTVTLEPGQSVIAVLSASKGVMNVKIRYQAVLSGLAAVNYNPTYKGHHFWALYMSSMMADAGVSNKIISEEVVQVDYLSNAQVELVDPKNKDAPRKIVSLVDPLIYAGDYH